MKLSTSNTFDVSQIAETTTYQEIQPFFDYINTFTSDVVQGFNKKITLSDNVNYTQLTLTVQHGVPINIGKYTPVAVFIQSETPFISYKLSTNADSSRNLSVFFKENHNVIAKSAIWQAGTIVRYSTQDVSPFSVGDVVTFSTFGTASNNGSYLITEIDTTDKYIYVINRHRTSATGDETKTGFDGSSLVRHPISVGLINA